ncbi:MAG: acetyl/propionyl/methylcrotonyl-CoA carboxylase subunit alpha [Gammaproteobacteria bacterium]|nr:MAG: acetyl/propionyl/methylcrotonyl-CoA carboxylase subunit alpha [Gammaproteobacteria bacterium]
MFSSLLIANRGEIACRIMRTARRLGMRTIAVYSEADEHAQHVKLADVAHLLGPAPAIESYLNIDAVLAVAKATGARAIHPGYGFLSENAEFAEACASQNIVFVGPGAEAIRSMGSKIEAKRLVAAAGTPVVPGYHEDDQSDARLLAAAREIGFPVLIKASAGGGGKGMRKVSDEKDFAAALAGARREASAAFADDRMLIERYLKAPKHLEMQILADRFGHTLHLFERDCSVQRRHQKVIEEAPGPTVTDAQRERMGRAAVQAAKAVDYVGAGTVEFITQGDTFYFMEMNTRLQVEHPVTEAITGLDLVEWQLRIAAGEPLSIEQKSVNKNGHAIEARIYAENPRRKFLPSTGKLVRVKFPDNVRVDTGVVGGDVVSMHYDPMLAKVIAHGKTREEARVKLSRALAEVELAGVEHNVDYLRAVLDHATFRAGDYTTGLAEQHHGELVRERSDLGAICAALASKEMAQGLRVWEVTDGFRLNLPHSYRQRLKRNRKTVSIVITDNVVLVGDNEHEVSDVVWRGSKLNCRVDGQWVDAQVIFEDKSIFVIRHGDTERLGLYEEDFDALAHDAGTADRITSPMPGLVISLAVQVGDVVAEGDVLMVIEAMKMEHNINAPRDGKVSGVVCAVGDRVEEGIELVTFEAK